MVSNYLCSEDGANAYIKNHLQKCDEFFYLLCDYMSIAACVVFTFIVVVVVVASFE